MYLEVESESGEEFCDTLSEKAEIKLGAGAQVGDDVGEHFQGPGHISKYGNCCYSKSKMGIKY